MRQMSKYVLSSVVLVLSVVIVDLLFATYKFFADCECPNFLIDVIAVHCRQTQRQHLEISVSSAPKK